MELLLFLLLSFFLAEADLLPIKIHVELNRFKPGSDYSISVAGSF